VPSLPDKLLQRNMNVADELSDEQFERHALALLQRELGADGLARFLRLNRSGTGDYTTDRDEWQKDLTLDAVLESIRENRRSSRPAASTLAIRNTRPDEL
jgi:hypothetical protein